jgi:ATP-dependent protease ClpP protease subunit
MRKTTKSQEHAVTATYFAPERTMHWMGGVSQGNFLDNIDELKSLMAQGTDFINLVVTSAGGPTGIAMSFYDSVRKVYRANLRTIGAGDVDSSGIIVFLAGNERYITTNTTMLLHLASRTFDVARRYTVQDIEAMAKEDKLKDFQYASVISENSSGRLTTNKVLGMMAANTILTSLEAVELGLAHYVL